MADLFEEVEGRMRSDQYRALALRVLPWVLAVAAAALIAALGYWGWESYRTSSVNKASEAYSQGINAFSEGRRPEAERLWTDVSKSPAKAYKAMALMQLGGLKMDDNKPAEAVKFFDEAATAAPDDMIGDAARLKSAFALFDTRPYAELEARLLPLTKEKRPYRVQALEALGFAKLMAGNMTGARGDFAAISQMLDAPESARVRANAAKGLIDSGSAASTAAAVKAALALPAAPALPQAGGPALIQPQQGPGPQ